MSKLAVNMHAKLDLISRWESRGLLSRRTANELRADALGLDVDSYTVTETWPSAPVLGIPCVGYSTRRRTVLDKLISWVWRQG